MAFAPADDPQVMALVLIDEPEGVYYGGNRGRTGDEGSAFKYPALSEYRKNGGN